MPPYFGGAGVNPSRLRPGSGFAFGFGAFLTSFLPLSLLPMDASVPQKGARGKVKKRMPQNPWDGILPILRNPCATEEDVLCKLFPAPVPRAPAFDW